MGIWNGSSAGARPRPATGSLDLPYHREERSYLMPFLLWFQLLLKRVEPKRDRLSCCDLSLPGTNYRLPGPWGVFVTGSVPRQVSDRLSPRPPPQVGAAFRPVAQLSWAGLSSGCL